MEALKNQDTTGESNSRNGRQFPKEAYQYEAPITQEGLNKIRELVAAEVDSEELEVIDGFGRIIHA